MVRKIVIYLIAALSSLGCVAQQCFVFAGSYNNNKNNEGIYIFEMDTISGALTKVSTVDNVLNPAYLTLSPNGKYLYACTEAKIPGAGSVSSYLFNPKTKNLTIINSQQSAGENPVYVATDKSGKWLVNGCYTVGSMGLYSLDNGIIGAQGQKFFFRGKSINSERQERAHIHSTVFSPDYKYLYTPDLGSDKIWCFKFDSTLQYPIKPAFLNTIKTTAGSGPRHLVFHPNGKFAYCTEELSGTVSVYSYNNGKLKHRQRINAHPDSLKSGFSGSDIHISADGKFLYSSNRGDENNIAIFSIQPDGKLTLIGYHPSGGNHPRIFALTPTNKFVVVANQVTGNIVVFKRNATTGLLEDSGVEVKVDGVSCVKIRQY